MTKPSPFIVARLTPFNLTMNPHKIPTPIDAIVPSLMFGVFAGGTGSGSAPPDTASCPADDMECLGNVHDRLGMEAIRSLHQQLDDDDNGNIDLTESDDVSFACNFFEYLRKNPFKEY